MAETVVVAERQIGEHHRHLLLRKDPEPPVFSCLPPGQPLWVVVEALDKHTGVSQSRTRCRSEAEARDLLEGLPDTPPIEPEIEVALPRFRHAWQAEGTPTAFGVRTGD